MGFKSEQFIRGGFMYLVKFFTIALGLAATAQADQTIVCKNENFNLKGNNQIVILQDETLSLFTSSEGYVSQYGPSSKSLKVGTNVSKIWQLTKNDVASVHIDTTTLSGGLEVIHNAGSTRKKYSTALTCSVSAPLNFSSENEMESFIQPHPHRSSGLCCNLMHWCHPPPCNVHHPRP
jgi:hypothetical protein